MRILWLSHFVPYPPTGHGALQRSHQLLKEAARRHEVHLLALSPPGAFAGEAAVREAGDALGAMCAAAELFPIRPDARGLRRMVYAAAASVGGATHWERWFWSPAMFARVRELAQGGGFDVVHADAVFLAPYLAPLAHVPLALNHHNLESHLLRRRAAAHASRAVGLFFARQADRVEALERALAPRAAVNVMVSDLDGDRLREVAPGAVTHTVPNGVDVDYFRVPAGSEAAAKSLVFAGGMDWFPNRAAMQWLAAELWPALTADEPARTMRVIGKNPPPEIVEAASRDDRLQVLGFVDDVRPHVGRSAVYLCPIQVGGGTRLKILDALAMERPLVSTAVGVEGLSLEDGVHYLGAETPGEFARQLRRLDGDPALAASLARAGRAFVEARYSWRGIGEQLAAAYDEAAGAVAVGR